MSFIFPARTNSSASATGINLTLIDSPASCSLRGRELHVFREVNVALFICRGDGGEEVIDIRELRVCPADFFAQLFVRDFLE